jgi:hypothetical protein
MATQMPGGVNAAEYFVNTHIWFGGAWQAFNGGVSISPPGAGILFGNIKLSPTSDVIWDKACST